MPVPMVPVLPSDVVNAAVSKHELMFAEMVKRGCTLLAMDSYCATAPAEKAYVSALSATEDAGKSSQTFVVGPGKFTSAPALLEERTTSRLRVVPLVVYVPLPT